MIDTLLIGGRGAIGSGLRTYLPRLDADYHITSVDLPGAGDKATDPDAQRNFIDLNVTEDPQRFRELLDGLVRFTMGGLPALTRERPSAANLHDPDQE